jgi:hypothetical protein
VLAASTTPLTRTTAPLQQAPATTPAPTPAPAPVPTQTQQQNGGGVDNGQLLALAAGALALIAVIWMVIVRDARKTAGTRARTRVARSGGEVPSPTRRSAKSRKLSPAERRRRKRSRAR